MPGGIAWYILFGIGVHDPRFPFSSTLFFFGLFLFLLSLIFSLQARIGGILLWLCRMYRILTNGEGHQEPGPKGKELTSWEGIVGL